MGRHVVCPVGELPPGERKIVECEGRSIGVFNLNGSFYAVRVKSYDVTVERGDDDDPSIETFDVSVERELIVLHLS